MSNPDINAAIDYLAALATTAGASLASPITDVARADPVPSPTGRSIRVWYAGEAETPLMGDSVNSDVIGERAVVTCYWPLQTGDLAAARARDSEVFLLKHALRAQITSHKTLGGSVTDLTIDPAAPVFDVVNGTPYRALELRLTLAFSEYLTAA